VVGFEPNTRKEMYSEFDSHLEKVKIKKSYFVLIEKSLEK